MTKRNLGIALITTVLAAFGTAAVTAAEKDDKYALKSPGGIAFADFKGYEDWATISTAKTDVLKVIAGNPAIIKAFKSGVPGNGQPFPDGSKIAKMQWKTKKNPEASFDVDVPELLELLGAHLRVRARELHFGLVHLADLRERGARRDPLR